MPHTAVCTMPNINRVKPKQVQFFKVEQRPENKPVDSSFQFAIWPVLAMAQYFAMMPIVGVRCRAKEAAKATDRLQFRWRTLRVLWTLAYLVLGSILTYMYMHRMTETGVTAKNMGGGIYFLSSLLCNLLFLRLATKWKTVITNWTRTELRFLNAPYQRTGMLLSTKIRLTAACYFSFSFFDYLFFSVQTVFNYSLKKEACQWGDEDHLARFFTMENRYIFELIPFNLPMAIMKTIIDIVNQLGSSYGNVFIMLTSIGMSTRFNQLNTRLKTLKMKKIDEKLWCEIRHHYVELCELLDIVDNALAPIILLSCSTNLFFICFQLLNIFEKLPHIVNYIYYWYSLLYLIARTAGVFLSAAAIHDASRVPGEIIKSVVSSEWSAEVDRFSDQINGETVALSGMKFFYLTRKVLLTMVGTIVTYELVLLQFAESTKETDDKIESAEAGC